LDSNFTSVLQKAGEILLSSLIACGTHLIPIPQTLEVHVTASLLEYHTA